jgi:hypothetical protein
MILSVAAAIVGAAIVAILLRSLWIRTGLNTRQTAMSIGVAALVTGVIALAATGRLSWIAAMLTALLPFARRLGGLLLTGPVFNAIFPHLAARLRRGRKAKASADSSQATTESQYFRMTLHHATGHMDGEIKLGPKKGRFLSELRLSELVGLLGEIQDYDSQRLLETYLDHHHPEWRRESSGSNAQTSSGMSRDEALDALGLTDGATPAEIVAAHRRLIQRLHPDRGGSTYLAALLNRAKDILLHG